MIWMYNDKDDNGGYNDAKVIYMETAPFDFYLEEKKEVDWIYQPFKNCKLN